MAIPALVGGFLPRGRHLCSLAEVEAMFVTAVKGSKTRAMIWRDFRDGLALLDGAVRVYDVWIGGSFVSAKADPRDIDAVFLISNEERARASPADRKIIESFVTPVNLKGGGVGRAHGLNIDSYVVGWQPHHGSPKMQPYNRYVVDRGYWDDFWSRRRVSSSVLPPQRADSFPQRGYLEVSLHAYA